jgi:hypothetical protein
MAFLERSSAKRADGALEELPPAPFGKTVKALIVALGESSCGFSIAGALVPQTFV